MPKSVKLMIGAAFALVSILMIFAFATETVSQGHEAAGARFGKVLETPLTEGFHFVDPLVNYTHYDLRNNAAEFDDTSIPTADQMTSTADITVQYRFEGGFTPEMLQNTGNAERVKQVILVPTVRNVVRSAARTLATAEQLFNDEDLHRFQETMITEMREAVGDKGIVIEDVLVRDVKLPLVISQAIDKKKERQQQSEMQKAELERATTELQTQVAKAEADAKAADFERQARISRATGEAEALRIRGQGEADAISKVRKQLGTESYTGYLRASRWNGALPRVSTGTNGGLFLQIDESK